MSWRPRLVSWTRAARGRESADYISALSSWRPVSRRRSVLQSKNLMDTFSCDVLIVGGGGAGLRAAIAVAETYPSVSVTVISKVYPRRSHTVSAEGGAAAVIKSGDSLDAH